MTPARRRKGKPTQLKAALGRVMKDLGLESANTAFEIAQRWEAVVGPEVARHCRPVAMRGNVLEAVADSSVWCQQLQLQRPAILAALAREMGDRAPTDLRLRVG